MKEKLNTDVFRDVTVRQLRVLAAVAATGRIRAAALDLDVTPPAVTQQIGLLEKSAGLPLLERSKRGVRLTDAGQLVLGVHAKVEAALAEGSVACREMRGLGRGRITVGAVSTAKYLAPRIIAAFAAAHPRVEVRLQVGNRDEIVTRLGELDLAIMGNPPDSMDVEHRTIGPHPHLIIAPPGHRLAQLRRIAPSRLADETFLVREVGSGTRKLMERTFAKLDVAPKAVTEFGSNETIKQAVMAGLGVAFLSAHTVAAEVGAGWLAVLPVEGMPVMRKWFAVRVKGRQQMPASSAMWEFVAVEGARFLPDVKDLTRPAARAARR